jgi:hypothetical protein
VSSETVRFIVSLHLQLSALLITASSFLLGLYLSERRHRTADSPLLAYKVLILVQMAAVICLYLVAQTFVVMVSAITTETILMTLAILIPEMPAIAVLYILFKYWS